ncbi:Fungalysin metallopeptidase-domain-containing protein [Paraphysoderma sedebokerense]|nr:Fungalysin metallopeptidase-domain-containing protein [Paraphysoderma sedebokerense]
MRVKDFRSILSLSGLFALYLLGLSTAHPFSSFGWDLDHGVYELYNEGANHPKGGIFTRADPVSIALDFLVAKSGVPASDMRLQNAYTDTHNGVTHAYFIQQVNNLDVFNGFANVHIKNDRVVGFYNSFVDPSVQNVAKLVKRWSMISPKEALAAAVDFMNSEYKMSLKTNISALDAVQDEKNPNRFSIKGVKWSQSDVVSRLGFLAVENGTKLIQVWDVNAPTARNWFNAQITPDGKVAGFCDWTAAAVYEVFPSLGFSNDPSQGARERVLDPEQPSASPKGWTEAGLTIGNNVIARESANNRSEPQRSAKAIADSQFLNNFTFPLSNNINESIDASLTQVFYSTNLLHDIAHGFGFTESAGNFQQDNFGKGGQGNDPVIAEILDLSQKDNAIMRTPGDGRSPILTTHPFTFKGTPQDPGFDNSIIIHEYAHGISARLIGGSRNANCLQSLESRALSEGWSDAIAVFLKMTVDSTRDDRVLMAPSFIDRPQGIRIAPYSTDIQVNNLTYSDLRKQEFANVHAAGTVWATMLYEMYWNLVDKNGFDVFWFNGIEPVDGVVGGNRVAMQLIIDGLKLTRCNPTFLNARDAILAADRQTFNGQFSCEIQRAFAKRGLGASAGPNGRAGFDVSRSC